jgi:hypothetical protein
MLLYVVQVVRQHEELYKPTVPAHIVVYPDPQCIHPNSWNWRGNDLLKARGRRVDFFMVALGANPILQALVQYDYLAVWRS